jgi:hypothetical protein
VKSLDAPLPPWGALASIGAGVGLLMPWLIISMLKKERTMSPLEKAFNALVILLCQEVAKKDEQLDKLRTELDARPTREQLTAAEQRELRAGDELHKLQRQVADLEKQLQDTREANVALVRAKAKKTRAPTRDPR